MNNFAIYFCLNNFGFVKRVHLIIYNNMQEKTQQSQIKTPIKLKNPFLIKFSTQQRPNRIHSLNRLNYPQNLQKDGTIIAKRDIIEHELFNHHVVQNNMRIQGGLKKLNAAFIHDKVPQFYAYHFMNRLVHASLDKIEDKILKQLQQIRAKRSYFHVISNAIKARQGCLKQLQRCLDNLFNNQDDNLTKHVFRQEIMHYRKLTGFVISHIRSWKQSLNQISPQIYFTTYLYHNQDYLIKVLNDCQFIFNSFLTKHLKFSYRNDPYIMRPYVDGKQSKYLDIFKFEEEDKGNYMIDLNFLASQRAKYLEQKMNSKNDKMKQIERIYHYKDTPLSSRIIVRRAYSRAQNIDNKDENQKQQKPQPEHFVDNYMSNVQSNQQLKKLKLNQLNKKSQKIKKIKQMFGKTSQSSTRLINPQMFDTLNRAQSANKLDVSPYQKKLRYTQFHNKKANFQAMNYQSDFENLLRKKQLQVLQGGQNLQIGEGLNASRTTQRSFKNIKIKDNLSQSRKFITKQEGVNQLEKLLNQLDTFSPQKLQNFILKKKQDPASSSLIQFNEGKTAKSRLLPPSKTLLEHNQEVYVSVRNQVIEQIEKDMNQKTAMQQKRKKQNQQIQQLLQKKINQQSLKILKDSRAKQLEGREHLAKQMSSSDMFGYDQSRVTNSQKLSIVQQQLKKQMQLKWLRQVQEELKRKTQLNQLQKIKIKQEKQLDKQVQKVKQKQQLQKRYEQIQRQERSKAIKKQIQLDEERKKQIETQMKAVIQRQKKNMQKFAASQKVQVEQQLREAMKIQFLDNIKKQNAKFYQDAKKQEEVLLKQKEYRDQVRSRIEQEYKLGQQLKQNRQKEQKAAKLRLVKQKLGQFDKTSLKNGNQSKIQSKIQNSMLQIKKQQQVNLQQMKSRITQFPDFRQSVFPKYQKSSQTDKKKLRQQFQLELFAFRKPQTYDQNNQEDRQKKIYKQADIPIKDFRTIIDKQMKQKQTQQKKQKDNQNLSVLKIQPTKQDLGKSVNKNQQFNINIKDQNKIEMNKSFRESQVSQKFTRFSQKSQRQNQRQKKQEDQLIRMKLGMTVQEYQIYKKKKDAITAKRDLQAQNQRRKIIQQKQQVQKVIDQFQKMDNLNFKETQFNNLKDIYNLNAQDDNLFDNLSVQKQEENKPAKNKNQIIIQQDLQQIDIDVKIDKKNKKNDQYEQKLAKVDKSPKKNKRQQKYDDDIISINSRVTSYAQKRFATSGSEDESEKSKPKKQLRKKSKKKKLQQIKQQASDQQDQNKQKDKNQGRTSKMSNKKQVQNIPQPPKKTLTAVKFRQIPVAALSQFFNDHFQHLPKVIKKINIYKKQQLMKFLLEHQSFTILQYIKQSISIGMGIFLFNQNKSKYRSLNIVHLGSYDEQDYLQLLLNVVRHCFKNDPCEQIAMSNIYDKQVEDQWNFVRKFQKKFDPYGAIFQKKIFNSQYQRKFVLRRSIGQPCHVRPYSQFNRGIIKLQMTNLIVQSSKKQQVARILQADNYNEVGYKISFPGWLGHYLAQKYSQDSLALLITKGTIKDSTMREKSIGSLAKLALSIKKNNSYQRMSQISQIKQQKYHDIMTLNLDLISKKQPVLSYPPQQIETPLQCTRIGFKDDIHLSYDFYSQTIQIKIGEDNDEYLCKYLRYTPNKKNKSFILKSSTYSTRVVVLPCKSTKYKIFIMDAQQYEGILSKQNKQNNQQNKLDISVYLRILFGNVPEHQIAEYDHIWIPQINIKHNKYQLSILQQFAQAQIQTKGMSQQNKILNKQILHSNGIIRNQMNFTYTDYLGNSLKISPSHRDLVITPPFFIGILNMQIETAQQGSPIWVKKVEKNDISWIKQIEKVKKDSD